MRLGPSCWLLCALLGLPMRPQILEAAGTFELQIRLMRNERGVLADGRCCQGGAAPPCAREEQCRTYFRACLKEYQLRVVPGEPCVLGAGTTPVLGGNTFAAKPQEGAEPVGRITVPFQFAWPLQGCQHLCQQTLHLTPMSQPPEDTQPSTAPQDQPGGSQEPARGRKRWAPAWSSAEIVDLIEVWGEASNVHDLRTSHRNASVYSRMAASLAARGHQRSREQVRCKVKDLRQSYSRACQPGADPEACPHFHALDRLLGAHAVPAPRDVIDPGAEGPLLEMEEEGSESQEPAASLPGTRDPRGTPPLTCVV